MENPHKRLKAWQLAMDIAVDVYKVSETFPEEEKFGLTSQSRRSAVSMASNIAELAGGIQKGDSRIFCILPKGP
jgi:four helix bundle protein